MSHSFHDLLSEVSGYSCGDNTSFNSARHKTLDDYPPVVQPRRKSDIAVGELVLDVGFDTEYVYNPQTKQNDILSYQSYVVLPDGTGVPDIIYPPGPSKSDRLSCKQFIQHVVTALLRRGLITEWPGKVNLYAHFLRADITSFSDFWSEYKISVKGIRNTVSSFKNRYGIDFDDVEGRHVKSDLVIFDLRTSPPRCSNVTFTDTLLITPGGMGLAECGEMLGLPKLTIPAPYSVSDMRAYLEGDKPGFEAYAVRDAEIAVRYALQVRTFCQQDLMIDRVPTTIGAMAVSRFRKTLKETTLSPEQCMGTVIQTRERWNQDKQRFITSHITSSVPSRELFETFAINCYHGGRNECFMMGVTPDSHWYDYDLAGAYTTGLLDIMVPDYDRIQLSRNADEYCGHTMGFALVSFSFPDSVRYPCLPVRTDQYGLFFPSEGESYATAPEIALALSLGASVTVKQGIIVPWKTSIPGSDSAKSPSPVFQPFVKQVRDNRNRYPKDSLEEKFWKEIGNSLYGKLAQGLYAKTAFDIARGTNSPLPPSSVTQPFFAAHVTGFVRAVIGELMNSLPVGAQVVSVTTDGFLTDCPLSELDMSGTLSSRFQSLCDIADPGSSMLVCKHEVRQLIAMKTRGQLTLKPVQGKPIVHARAGVKPPGEVSREQYNDYMTALYLNRFAGQTLPRNTLLSTRDMWLTESDLVSREQDIRLNLEFDFKRQLTAPSINSGHIFMHTRPWKTLDEALSQRGFFDDWRQTHTLKNITDWEDWTDFLYCRKKFSSSRLKVGARRSDDILKMLLLRALKQKSWGFTAEDSRRYTHKQLAEWLTDNGYATSVDDFKNASRAALPDMHFGPLTPGIQKLMGIIQTRFPSVVLP